MINIKNMGITKGKVFNKTDSISGVAILNDSIIGPRKMRLIADLIRNESVDNAFSILSCNQKRCTDLFKKLLLSAVSNCEKKCESLKTDICDAKDLYISKICVDSAGMLKRKRRSHVFLVVEPKNSIKNLDNKKNEKKAKKETEKKETKSENSESKKSTKK